MKKVAALLVVVLLSALAIAQNISLPAGTTLRVKLDSTLATFSSKTGDPFSGRVTEAVLLDGKARHPHRRHRARPGDAGE